MSLCRICGLSEDDHHAFVPMPDKCQCPPGEWGDGTITPICADYTGNGTEVCRTCEHDRECHGVTT